MTSAYETPLRWLVILAAVLLTPACLEVPGADEAGGDGPGAGTPPEATSTDGSGSTTGTPDPEETSGSGEPDPGDGSTGEACPDADDDGVTVCDGDCDDEEALAVPGALEICGDGIDNDCDGDPDPDDPCDGRGTFVSAAIGSDYFAGTRELPLRTVGAAILRAQEIGNGQAVFVAEGDYDERIAVAEGVGIRGGYQCAGDADCSWEHEPSQSRPRILRGLSSGPEVTADTVVEGLGLRAGLQPNPVVLESTVQIRGGLTLQRNIIHGPTADGNCALGCTSVAVSVDPSGSAAEEPNALVADNEIIPADAAAPVHGIRVTRRAAEVRGNVISGGSSDTSIYGISSYFSNAWIVGNTISAGSSTARSVGIYSQSDATIEANFVNTDSEVGTCSGDVDWCGGIEAVVADGPVRITNNVVHGMDAPNSFGMHLTTDSTESTGDLVVHSNTIGGGGTVEATDRSAAISCSLSWTPVTIRNNILLSGDSDRRYGVFQWDGPDEVCNVQAFENNAVWIPASSSNDCAFRLVEGGTTQTVLRTVEEVNAPPWSANNILEDPALDEQWHLTEASACIDQGSPVDVPTMDFEGDPRDETPDIGADERTD